MNTQVGTIPQQRANRVVGGIIVLACVPSAAILGFHGDPPRGLSHPTIYPTYTWFVLAGLVAAGLVLLFLPRAETLVAVCSSAALVLAAQLCGWGIYATKHWGAFYGTVGGYTDVGLMPMRLLAAGLGVAMGLTVFACLIVVFRGRPTTPARPIWVGTVTVVLGLAVATTIPFLAADARFGWQITELGAFFLIFAGPFGMGVALSGLLSRSAAAGALAAVVLSSLLIIDYLAEEPKLSRPIWIAVGAAAICALLQFVADRKDARSPGPSADAGDGLPTRV